MTPDGYCGYWSAIEPLIPPPTLNRCPVMRRVWEIVVKVPPRGGEGVNNEENKGRKS